MFLSKKFLGIDIGTSAIKMVELSGWKEKRKLENYSEIKAEVIFGKPFRAFERNILLLSNQEIARAIKTMSEEAKIKTRHCILSIPDFSSFFTNFELPPMTREELSQAVVYEAKQHIPLPLGEVTLDWEVIGGKISGQEKLKILLVAVPNEVINRYQEIARLSNLQLLALEAETFGLVRSLIPTNEKGTFCLLDIGAQTTTCSIIDQGILKVSNSLDLSGDDLTEKIATSLSLDYSKAQELKEKYGLKDFPLSSIEISQSQPEKNIKEILLPLITDILREIEKISSDFFQTEGKAVQKFIIAGGTALLPGLREYFEKSLRKETKVADPFVNILYPAILEQTLKEIGPSYAIAVGMALRGFI